MRLPFLHSDWCVPRSTFNKILMPWYIYEYATASSPYNCSFAFVDITTTGIYFFEKAAAKSVKVFFFLYRASSRTLECSFGYERKIVQRTGLS